MSVEVAVRVQNIEVAAKGTPYLDGTVRANATWSEADGCYVVYAPLTGRGDDRTDPFPRALVDAVWGEFNRRKITDPTEAANVTVVLMARWVAVLDEYEETLARLTAPTAGA